ncbi:2-C-methyl-D-erythritol 4-phosphate cytidylyltransferase [Leucobacter exalbidus]|uniref:2-C-methyl-D-erythritol 4-phosphate cytidylyltransferase n=1 Tax=Leucobacter exalbidus TaxID=662960 RepID=A0A940T1N9_9MICO|nr:2-C-methyl-D-erythritol 4-phosphate cytidylyltransferase [Leucobacter exalbidus]MBP1327045.1 2-C-methyl-D-erythritol 4-phosphate cytidylyltransferase [Leucobacter exalbidus]
MSSTEHTPHTMASLGVVLVAAGRGERLGADVPKAFYELHGRALVEFSIAVITSLPHAGHLVIVAPESHAAATLSIVDAVLPETSSWDVSVVAGGRERHESVRFGLAALGEHVDTVLVHDAARPFASAELFERVIAEVRRTGAGVIPAIAVVDTLKRVDEAGVVRETVDRSTLVAVQTPQGFPRDVLESAHSTAQLHGELPTDDAELVQRDGGTVHTVAGELQAHKLTSPGDLPVLEHFLAANAAGIDSRA